MDSTHERHERASETQPPVRGEEVDATGKAGRLPPDVFVAIAVLLFCAVAYYMTTLFPPTPSFLGDVMGPEAFPRMLIGLMAFFAMVLLLASFRKAANSLQPITITSIGAATITVLLCLTLPVLGTSLTTVATFIALGAWWGERRWALMVCVGVAMALAIDVGLSRLLMVRLPQGIILPALF